MKKLSTIIMALALVLGMSQCKKQETPTTGNTTPIYPGVDITVKVGDNEGKAENGEKHNIAPQYGLFAFSSGDVLYVGHDGQYVGSLTFNGACFDGTIHPNPNVTDKPLHFYFVGNAAVTGTPSANQTTSLSINIANQSTNLPVLSYGASNELYTGPNTTYSTTLKNKCALVRFDLQHQGDYVVTLSGVPTQATVNFANPTAETAIVATEGQTNGSITLYGESGNTAYRWAILLPGTNLSTGHGDLNTTSYSGNVNLAALGTNDYVNSGISINNPLPLPDPPAAAYAVKTSNGTLTQFSVSANKKVYFSRANLRHGDSQSSIPGWSLHAHQFDEHEDAYGGHGYGTYTGYNATYDMDRICWGRLANDSGHTYTAGSMWIYADNLDLTRTNGTDWGTVLTTEGNNWRMLTASEWNYLFNATARGTRRFLKVCVNAAEGVGTAYGVHTNNNFGVLLLPDLYDGEGLSMKDWRDRTYTFNNKDGAFVRINLTSDGTDDVSKMLNAGAVFLPALGYRNADQYVTEQYQDYTYYDAKSVGGTYVGIGYYWSSTRVENGQAHEENRMAKLLKFDNTINAYSEMLRGRGACVRLVWDAN